MRILGFSTVRPEMASTRTAEDFMKFLGQNPARLGIVSTLYDQYTASHLTEALMNTYSLEKGKPNQFQRVDSFLIEWDLNIQRIKRVYMTAAPEGDGLNGSDVIFHFGENYYQKNDTFICERSRQQFIVMNRPQRVRDNDFLIVAKILDDSYESVVDPSGAYEGASTRFVTNLQPEMHEEGYTKYQSNVEKHRTYMSTHRVDVDMSAQYASMEDVFIQIGKGSKDDPVYKMNSAEKDCLDSFMLARNNNLVFGKTDVDKHGRPKIYDEMGRPIISGDGLIAQVERFATKMVFNKLTPNYFKKALSIMTQKSEKSQGNHYMFVCNNLMWLEVQDTMEAWIQAWKTVGTFVFSKASNGYVDLGATYQSFEFGGNTVTFKVDRSLDVEYPTRKFGMFLDLTADKMSGKPAVEELAAA